MCSTIRTFTGIEKYLHSGHHHRSGLHRAGAFDLRCLKLHQTAADLFQTIFFLPYVTNTLAVGLVFMILFKKLLTPTVWSIC